MNKESCLDVVKEAGWRSVKELAEQESRTVWTIRHWFNNNPVLFSEFLIEAAKRKVKK